jgi:hypothetical protein
MVELFTDTDLEVIVHKIYHPRWGTEVMDPVLPISSVPDEEIKILEQKLSEFLRNELLKTGKRRKDTLCTLLPIVYVLRFPETPPTIYTQKFVGKAPCWFICSEAQNIDSGFLFTLYENFQFFGMTITAIKNPHTLASILLLAKFIVEDKMEKAKFDQLCLCLLTLTKYI